MNSTSTRTVRVPPAFWEDHYMRSDLENPGTVIKTTSRGVDVELDEIAFADLLSDAKFYATSEPGWFGPELSGIVKSAKATLRILTS